MPQLVTNASDLHVEIEICRSAEHRVYVNKESDLITETHIKEQCRQMLEEDVIVIIYKLIKFFDNFLVSV